MDFGLDKIGRSITFEFVYKNYTINIADYLSHRPDGSDLKPEGKISIMIMKRGDNLSTETVERLASYMMDRMDCITVACGSVLEIGPMSNDQAMYHLLNAIDLIIPN